jgi:hypothetical protein
MSHSAGYLSAREEPLPGVTSALIFDQLKTKNKH